LAEEEKNSGLIAIAYEAIRTSPKDALWLASELGSGLSRDALISHAVREWAVNDSDAPVAWAEQMQSSSLREQVFANVAILLSETDPARAAALALEKLPNDGGQNSTVVSIVQRWAQTEPNAAADWVVRFPQGPLRDAALENLIQLWADKNADDAAGWLNQ